MVIETPYFFTRTRRHLEQWQVILLVDQSGSMVDSVIHSAVTAACLWGLPGVRTHLVAFDTEVVDLTADVDDPVELLMKVQLGGGTDIARAAEYGAGLVDRPRRSIVVLISDFYEGGDPNRLVRVVRGLVEQGTKVLGLAALDEQANPDYDRATAQRLADVGAHMGAMTPASWPPSSRSTWADENRPARPHPRLPRRAHQPRAWSNARARSSTPPCRSSAPTPTAPSTPRSPTARPPACRPAASTPGAAPAARPASAVT